MLVKTAVLKVSSIDDAVRNHTKPKGHILKQRGKYLLWWDVFRLQKFTNSVSALKSSRSLCKLSLGKSVFNWWHSKQNLPEVNTAIALSCFYCSWLSVQCGDRKYPHFLPKELGNGAAIQHFRAFHRRTTKQSLQNCSQSQNTGKQQRGSCRRSGGATHKDAQHISASQLPAPLNSSVL